MHFSFTERKYKLVQFFSHTTSIVDRMDARSLDPRWWGHSCSCCWGWPTTVMPRAPYSAVCVGQSLVVRCHNFTIWSHKDGCKFWYSDYYDNIIMQAWAKTSLSPLWWLGQEGRLRHSWGGFRGQNQRSSKPPATGSVAPGSSGMEQWTLAHTWLISRVKNSHWDCYFVS